MSGSGTEGHGQESDVESELSSKAEEIVDKKVTKRQLYGSGLDISKVTKRRLIRSAKYAVGLCRPRRETQQIFSLT